MSDEQTIEQQDVEQAETVETSHDSHEAPAAEPKPTETVDFWKAKAREQEKRAKANADAATKLKEIEDRDLSELEKAQRAAKEYGDELAALKARALRNEVALAKGIPAELAGRLQGRVGGDTLGDAADQGGAGALVQRLGHEVMPVAGRLQGETEEELAADADKLLALVGTPKRTLQPDKGQGARETSAEADADAEYRKYFPTD